MALAHGVPIVPFAAVGIEHALEIVKDADDLLESPVGPLLRAAGIRQDMMLPLVKGIGPTPIPKPQKLWFEFLPPVHPADIPAGTDDERAWALRERVRTQLQAGIDALVQRCDAHGRRSLVSRLVDRLKPPPRQ